MVRTAAPNGVEIAPKACYSTTAGDVHSPGCASALLQCAARTPDRYQINGEVAWDKAGELSLIHI